MNTPRREIQIQRRLPRHRRQTRISLARVVETSLVRAVRANDRAWTVEAGQRSPSILPIQRNRRCPCSALAVASDRVAACSHPDCRSTLVGLRKTPLRIRTRFPVDSNERDRPSVSWVHRLHFHLMPPETQVHQGLIYPLHLPQRGGPGSPVSTSGTGSSFGS